MSAWIKKTLISLGRPVSNDPVDNNNNDNNTNNTNNNATDDSKKSKMTQTAPATLPSPKFSTVIDDEPTSGKKKKFKEKEKDKENKKKDKK